ncbi:PAAR domain-containing protein [Duganella sp. HH101]|nr:PAAR domain-containing protein [Duganella sp. HH101]
MRGDMGGKAIIRLGDKTSHNGTVLEGHQDVIVMGKPAAGVGHKVSCPKCPGTHTIVEGAVTHTIMGISTAVEGMKTSCGATLVASQQTDTIG